MRIEKQSITLFITLSVLILAVVSCAAPYTEYKTRGHVFFDKSTASLPKIDDEIVVIVERVEVHVVPDRDHIPLGGYNIQGCAYRSGKIYVIGYKFNGGIVVNHAILGHELAHLIHWKNGTISNPDSY